MKLTLYGPGNGGAAVWLEQESEGPLSLRDVEAGRAAIAELVGLTFAFFDDTVGMARFKFSRPDVPGEWLIHIQCEWRLCLENAVITGKDDRYERADPNAPDDDGWDPTDGGSLQELRLRQLLAGYGANERFELPPDERLEVTYAGLTGIGDLSVKLEGGLALQAFPTCSRGEAWRVFKAGGPHFVWPGYSEPM